jgi:SAM-dependent methyltransferase
VTQMTYDDSCPCAGKVYRNEGNRALLSMLSLVLSAKPGSAIDLGCGNGANAAILKLKGWNVTAVTVSPEEARIAATVCNEVYVADLNDGIPDPAVRPYDLVLLSHVLEHLTRPESLLNRLHALCHRDTLVAVALPNVANFTIRKQLLRGSFEYQHTGILDDTHLHFYTFHSGARLLRRAGLVVNRSSGEGWFQPSALRFAIPQYILDFLDSFVVRSWPNLFAVQSLYLATSSRPGAGASASASAGRPHSGTELLEDNP